MKKLAIGFRLTLWYLLFFAVAEIIFGSGMWVILRHNLYDIADDELEAQIDDVHRLLEAQSPRNSSEQIEAAFAKTYRVEHNGDYLQIQDESGHWIYRSVFFETHQIAGVQLVQLPKPVYEDRRLGRKHFRFLSAIVAVDSTRYIVQIGVSEGDIIRTLALFRGYLLLFAPLLLLAASAGGYWLSRRALAPVDILSQTAREITGTNLSRRLRRLETGDELQRLSDTLNEMLSRIEIEFLKVSRFTADASHELRTPIALIRTEAEIALMKPRDEDTYRDALCHVLSEAEKTSALIDTLLSLARADAGRELLAKKKTDLHKLATEAADRWGPRIAAHDLAFTVRSGAPSAFVNGDATSLSRLFDILLDNAVKYTPSGGSIEFVLKQHNERGIIEVSDTGIGVSPDDQGKIFERFYRADKARSRELGGAGLGLSIAQWIAEQHRGCISVQSSPGNGSTFTVDLPLYSDPPSASQEEK